MDLEILMKNLEIDPILNNKMLDLETLMILKISPHKNLK
jgi:hypothetical protein